MAMAVEITMVIALVLSIIVPGVSFLKGQRTKSRFKSHLAVNVVTFFGLLIVATVSILAGNTSALAATAAIIDLIFIITFLHTWDSAFSQNHQIYKLIIALFTRKSQSLGRQTWAIFRQ